MERNIMGTLKRIKIDFFLIVAVVLVSSFTACSSDDPGVEPETEPAVANQTILMFLPYAENLTTGGCLLNNLRDFEKSIVNNGGLNGNKLLVYISKDNTTSFLINIKYEEGKCVRDTLETYTFTERDYTTTDGITSILKEVKEHAPAYKYSMCIGCHGGGWLPVDKTSAVVPLSANVKSRMFGSGSSPTYQINTTTLAESIKNAQIKMQFILFDCCNMSNVETAYDLQDAAYYMIASTCEIIDDGMPYEDVGTALFENDYETVCNNFYEFYSTHTTPCGQIATIDLSKIENMAAVMKEINDAYPNGVSSIYNLQTFDGNYPARFFDLGDYVGNLCDDEALSALFNNALNELVLYKKTTEKYYTEYSSPKQKTVKTFSGITISEPSTDLNVKASIKNTGWYKASH